MAGRPPEARREPAGILLAEHEPEVAEMSARYLRQDGFRVWLVTSPEPTLAALTDGPGAAAVIDLSMPGLDPRRIRRALSSIAGSSIAGSSIAGRTPVIFLVADAKAPRPRGLAVQSDAAGARRWLARPFSPRQLVALVRDVLADARSAAATGSAASGSASAAIARWHDAGLTTTEAAVLAALTDNAGRVLSRRRLLAAAGRHSAGDRAADVYVAQLRAKLGSAIRIRTVRGAGYALTPPEQPSSHHR
ncbi:MAG TPA: response regulator transcription factor [Streptosporangiaceae bacterium]|nr:response regulator transcription factor [Streptosporangiaceae bacterium]